MVAETENNDVQVKAKDETEKDVLLLKVAVECGEEYVEGEM